METGLLTAARLERVLTAESDGEAVRLLRESGYPEMRLDSPETMDAAIMQAREETLRDLEDSVPDRRYVEIFRLRYDYHNLKAILKARAMGVDPDRMLTRLGRVPPEELKASLTSGELDWLPPLMAAAAREARETLERTRDPQLCDLSLDRWQARDELETAQAAGSAFLQGYVRARIDAANLRALVRTLRMGRTAAFLQGALLPGGSLAESGLLAVAKEGGAGLAELYAATLLAAAARSGADALRGGPLTEFERLCDDAESAYLAGAELVAFGEAPLVSYLAAREREYTNLRIVLMGRSAGLAPEIVRARLRTGGA